MLIKIGSLLMQVSVRGRQIGEGKVAKPKRRVAYVTEYHRMRKVRLYKLDVPKTPLRARGLT
jgi:hypothetical protein